MRESASRSTCCFLAVRQSTGEDIRSKGAAISASLCAAGPARDVESSTTRTEEEEDHPEPVAPRTGSTLSLVVGVGRADRIAGWIRSNLCTISGEPLREDSGSRRGKHANRHDHDGYSSACKMQPTELLAGQPAVSLRVLAETPSAKHWADRQPWNTGPSCEGTLSVSTFCLYKSGQN